jgi:hypothetical protein
MLQQALEGGHAAIAVDVTESKSSESSDTNHQQVAHVELA